MMRMCFLFSIVISFVCWFFLYRDIFLAGIGTVIHSFSPYFIYVCFDIADSELALAYMAVPVVVVAITKCGECTEGKDRIGWMALLFSAMTYIGIFHSTFWLVLSASTVIICLLSRQYILIPINLVTVLLNVLIRIDYWRFLFKGHINAYSVNLTTIADKGYEVGDFIMLWMYREGRPGIGFGVLISALVGIFLLVENKQEVCDKKYRSIQIVSVLLIIASYRWGIWDMVARVHPIILRFVSLVKTPGMLLGVGVSLLCIPMLDNWKRLLAGEKKYSKYLGIGTAILSGVSGFLMILRCVLY